MDNIVIGRPCRYTDKSGLQALNREAEKRNYNRQIMEDAIDRLPANATVALQPVMVHEHAQGKLVDPHLRCFVLVEPDTVGMSRVMLDVPMEMFDVLLTKEAVAAMVTRSMAVATPIKTTATTPTKETV
jgi:hypothetical protein